MINVEHAKQYLELATSFGLDTSDPDKAHAFIQMLRFVDAKMQNPKRKGTGGDMALCDELGIPQSLVAVWRNTDMHKIATRVVLAEFMTNESRQDVRNRLFALYQNWFPQALENTLRIAAGRVVGADGQLAAKQPPYTAQVQAFQAISANPLAEAWLSNTFLGDAEKRDEVEHMELREALKQKPALQLDAPEGVTEAPKLEPIEAEWEAIPDPVSSDP
jgi:hypothetical protein